MGRPAAKEVRRLKWSSGALRAGYRTIPDEVPVALTYDGTAYAVMMASPSDLADFALGFSLSEGVVDHVSEIEKSRHHRGGWGHRSPHVAATSGFSPKSGAPARDPWADGLWALWRGQYR